MKKRPSSFLKYVQVFWPIVAAVIATVAGYATLRSDVSAAVVNVEAQWVQTKDHEKRLNRLETAVEMLPEMRDDIKKLLQKR